MERDPQLQDSYIKKLNALLPAEITGLYLFLRTLENNNRDLDPILLAFVVAIGGLFYWLAPALIKVRDPTARLLYVLTFYLWAASIDINILVERTHWEPLYFLLTGVTAIWSFALPYVFDKLKTP